MASPCIVDRIKMLLDPLDALARQVAVDMALTDCVQHAMLLFGGCAFEPADGEPTGVLPTDDQPTGVLPTDDQPTGVLPTDGTTGVPTTLPVSPNLNWVWILCLCLFVLFALVFGVIWWFTSRQQAFLPVSTLSDPISERVVGMASSRIETTKDSLV